MNSPIGRFSRRIAVEEHLRLGLHRIAQLGTPGRELLRIGLDAVEIADLQPLAGEVLRHREGLRIGEHPLHLRVEHCRRAQLAPLGQRQQLLVRHRVPQEVTQPRRQLHVRDPVHPAGIVRVEIALDVKQEMRRDEHRLDRQGEALLHGLALRASPAPRTSAAPPPPRRSPAGDTPAAPAWSGSDRRSGDRSPDRRPGSACGWASHPRTRTARPP